MKGLRILFIGDIVGKNWRYAVRLFTPDLVRDGKGKALKRFLTLFPMRLEPETDDVCLRGIPIDIGKDNGRSLVIKRMKVRV